MHQSHSGYSAGLRCHAGEAPQVEVYGHWTALQAALETVFGKLDGRGAGLGRQEV